MNLTYSATVAYDGQKLELKPKGLTSTEKFYTDLAVTEIEGGRKFVLFIHVKSPIRLDRVHFEFFLKDEKVARVFSNGFQSWSESREFEPQESIPGLKGFAKGLLQNYGDYHFPQRNRGTQGIHSWSYTYLKDKPEGNPHLFASLNERTGYTYFEYDNTHKKLIVEKDCVGLELSNSYPVLEFVELRGKDNEVFDTWFKTAGIKAPKVEPAIGWTSWYHYYTNISEQVISSNLKAFQEHRPDIDIFQIDDGYQTRVGDWLSIQTNKFPRGMRALADDIHQAGFKAGLWLAPLVAEAKSELFAKHKDWFIKDEKGKFVSAGYNPMWSGKFYVLDVYHQEVRNYLRQVFKTVLFDWGYDMVKLDFLYAASILPRKDRTRGQVMYDAMEFLRSACANKIILGCGVPLGPSFGQVDYCRIGADIHLKWEHSFLKFLRNRERVSTIVALRSVLGRWQLNGRAFLNDPDVFILRKEKNKLTPTQQHTILTVNAILGRLIFTSDFLGDFQAEQHAEFLGATQWIHSEIEQVIQYGTRYLIRFTNQGNAYHAHVNLGDKPESIKLKKGSLELEPFETIVLMKN